MVPTTTRMLDADALRARRRRAQRFWSRVCLAAACVLLGNGLFGDRGLMQTIRARRAYAGATRDLARLKHENAMLRSTAQRLRNDPSTIEAVARGELGLARRGEILVMFRDLRK